jgi:ABC-type multidrug transport system fused ATPase/permease subunit
MISLFAVTATVFNVVGPKILSGATTELFTGLVAKFTGAGGIDFAKVGEILLSVLLLYAVSLVCNLIQGWTMATLSQKVCYNLRQEICEKISSATSFHSLKLKVQFEGSLRHKDHFTNSHLFVVIRNNHTFIA